MTNIGIIGYWGFGRGHAYVNLMFANMLKDDHKVFIFNTVVNKEGIHPYEEEEFRIDAISVTDYPGGWAINPEVFAEWIKQCNIKAVIFNEYDQWGENQHDLIKIARDAGCKVYGYLVSERFHPDQAKRYDRVFCPNMTQVRFFRQHRVRNFTFVPYSIDLDKIKPAEEKDNSEFVFFHPAGMIGVNERKNTKKVIEAFRRLDKKDAKLIITCQIEIDTEELPDNVEVITKKLNHDELMEYYKKAHVLVYPSKWDTIGISILESFACGTPVITTDFPPMNEYVLANRNGLVCKAEKTRYKGISVYAAEVDTDVIKHAMDMSTNEMILMLMKKNARYTVEELYDIKKNKKYLLDFLKKDLGEKND